MLVIGIDEAGYGPLLGPLVVAGTAFRVAGATTPAELSARLHAAVRGVRGLRLGDSKRVFGGTRDLSALELPVLAFLGATGAEPRTLAGMLAAVGAGAREHERAPWYRGEPVRFPLRCEAGDVESASRDLAGHLAAEGIEFAGFAAQTLTEAQFNEALGGGNKADVLFGAASRVLERLLGSRGAGEDAAAVFDRQGGRRYYAPPLQRRFPGGVLWAGDETPTSSDYVLSLPAGRARLWFRVGADHEFSHVGLASMLAKYLREAFMDLFNAHFAAICPGVAPTAGYTQDGRRWLDASRPAREAAGIPDSDLVRLR